MSDGERTACGTCPRHCRLTEGQIGFCRARQAKDGHVVPSNYGKITSIALDPIEKKPLSFFHPGSKILSIGSYGCNLRCPFCQNDSISQSSEDDVRFDTSTPSQLADAALRLKEDQGNIGIAYTYNEPLVGWEFVRDCAKEVHRRGMLNVLVSNGCADEAVTNELAPRTSISRDRPRNSTIGPMATSPPSAGRSLRCMQRDAMSKLLRSSCLDATTRRKTSRP